MNTASTRQHNWKRQLDLFSEINSGKRTRLGVFERTEGSVIDHWLEDGLPLEGVSVDFRDDSSTVAIMLPNFTHTVNDAKRIELHFSIDGTEDGLNVTDANGQTTLLRFETVGQ